MRQAKRTGKSGHIQELVGNFADGGMYMLRHHDVAVRATIAIAASLYVLGAALTHMTKSDQPIGRVITPHVAIGVLAKGIAQRPDQIRCVEGCPPQTGPG